MSPRGQADGERIEKALMIRDQQGRTGFRDVVMALGAQAEGAGDADQGCPVTAFIPQKGGPFVVGRRCFLLGGSHEREKRHRHSASMRSTTCSGLSRVLSRMIAS